MPNAKKKPTKAKKVTKAKAAKAQVAEPLKPKPAALKAMMLTLTPPRNSADDPSEKAREANLRRKAARFDLRLTKSRARDVDAYDHGLYALIDNQTSGAVNPALANHWVHSWTLDQVEDYLSGDDE